MWRRVCLQLGLMLPCELEQAVMPVETEFLADVSAMIFHGTEMNEELSADLLARFSFGNAPQDTALGWGEIAQAWMLPGERPGPASAAEQVRRQRRADIVLSGGNSPKTLDDFRHRAFLQD